MSQPTNADREKKVLFLSVVEAQLDAMYRTALRMLRHPSDAEDAVQDALHKSWRSLARFDCGENMKPWLFRILTNTCLDQLRARARMERRLVDYDDGGDGTQGTDDRERSLGASPEDLVADASVEARVEAEIARLSPHQQAVVHLIVVEQLTYEETAQALGLPVGTVRSRLSRARSQLCASLGDVLGAHDARTSDARGTGAVRNEPIRAVQP